MASKVLIADDSLTIQKVINITLANSGYELIECTKEDDLYRKIQNEKFDLVLLDFNLSDSKSGYDLAKYIFEKNSQCKIIVMLGTFDTVDESKFSANGIQDKIIKPFESSKLVQKCKDCLDGVEAQALSEEVQNLSEEETFIHEEPKNDLDSWKIDAPETKESEFAEESSEENIQEQIEKNVLESEVSGWGFEPGSIEEKFNKTFPDAIEENISSTASESYHPTSALIVSDELSIDLESPTSLMLETNEEPSRITEELLGEIDEELSPDSFWAVDDVVQVESEETEEIAKTNLDEITEDLTETVAAFKLSEDYNQKPVEQKPVELAVEKTTGSNLGVQSLENLDMDLLVEKLKIALKPEIEKMLKEEYRSLAEKVAWEIIPDLAENLIKKEIREISDSIN